MINATQKLGATRSSKPIRQTVNTDFDTLKDITLDYCLDDHFDAYALFQYLLSPEFAKLGRDSSRLKIYDNIANFHREWLEALENTAQKRKLSLTTIFDVIEFGKSRADPIFK